MPVKELHRNGFPGKAASAILPGQAVSLNTGDTEREVLPVATSNVEAFGIALASAGPQDAVTIFEEHSVVKVTALASLGAGANIGVASANGALGIVSAASGSVVHAIGKSVSAAAAGESFGLYIRPRQLSGTP
jgi:hypothetical protein